MVLPAAESGDPGAADAWRAEQLRALADQVERVMDAALAAARSPLWECAHADDVRGRLAADQARARSAAEQLRVEAGQAAHAARVKREDAAAAAAAAVGTGAA
jgi:hypothetical protein